MGTRFETVQRFTELYPMTLPGDIKLITLDAENVLTPYGDPTLFPGVLDQLRTFQEKRYGAHLAVATNNRNEDFLGALDEELADVDECIPIFSAIDNENKKKGPGMFLRATEYFGVDPRHAAHVDDQFLSLRGARMAGFGTLVLARPEGPNGHKGVKLGRPLDATARLVIAASQGLRHLWTDGIDG